ncbi:MAG: hypothetical protein Tp136DCM211861_13 [Prokaryotic dsDNA virus sp.]|jgi:DnaJ-class molecular chaperone|nr:MAG: hypothetical protein Tp136DCM211861_13 [Prokaryotic dsDNA virus sp.]
MTSSPKKCQDCNGSGWVRVASSWDEGDVVPDLCWECNGSGKHQEPEAFDECDIDKQGALK